MTLYWFKAHVIYVEQDARSETLDHHILADNFDEAKAAFETEWVPGWARKKTVRRIEIKQAKVVLQWATPALGAARRMVDRASAETAGQAREREADRG